MRVLGLDVGEKRIGVAKADSSTRIAIPIGFIEVDGTEWQKLEHLARVNNTYFFVIGRPRNNNGEETRQTLYSKNFAKVLTEKVPGAKIRFQDESFTSVVAEERLKSRKKRFEKGDIDAEAATIILQDFLESLKPIETNLRNTPINNSTGIKSAINEVRENATNITKKEADKVLLNAKKAKHKVRTTTKWISGISVLVIIALLVTGGALWYREIKRKERAEEYARQEAAMKAATFDFTIRPGETIFDIKDNLTKIDRNGESDSEERLPNYTAEEIDAAFSKQYDYSFLDMRPEGATLEGYLYPETHNYYGESTVEEILEAFLEKMGEVISENDLSAKYAEQGLTLHEGITLASVVQKEAASPEQPTVAQVFLSRLSYGIPLGSDVTVSYALDIIDPDRQTYTDNSMALKVDSCYNTRLYNGLPCGPIANPGLSALLAVANPSNTSYLYFLTGDDGVMYYSSTEAEHNQNIYSHCRELCNVSL